MDILAGLTGTVVTVVGAVLGVIFLFGYIWAARYRKVGPNEVLIVYGRRNADRGFRIVHGGGTFIWPVVEDVQILSMELMTIDVKTPPVITLQGVPITVEGVAQIKVASDDVSICTAAEQFLSKSQNEIMRIAHQTLEGHLRAILGTMTVEDIYKNRDEFARKVQEVSAPDLSHMGLAAVSFTIKDINDAEGYLDALGKPRIAEVKKDAVVGEAEAQKVATIKSADAQQIGEIARIEAMKKVAEANRDLEMKKAEFNADVNVKKADQDVAYDLQKYRRDQELKKEEMQIQMIERQLSIEIQARETDRRDRELDATVRKPAEAERMKIQQLADAEQYRIEAMARAEAERKRIDGLAAAEAHKACGLAEAEVIKAKGAAEAEIIRAKGFAEAEAMEKKAAAWSNYSEAALTQLIVERMPELAAAVAQPLAKTEKIVIVNQGGDSAGASRVTQDVVNMVNQMPPMVEAITGVNLIDLVRKVARKNESEGGPEKKG